MGPPYTTGQPHHIFTSKNQSWRASPRATSPRTIRRSRQRIGASTGQRICPHIRTLQLNYTGFCCRCSSGEYCPATTRLMTSYANGWCHWVDERRFLNGLAASSNTEQPLRNDDYSPFLHNVLLAFGCVSMPKTDSWFPASEALGPLFSQTATNRIDEELAMPLTTTSRGLMLLGSYHFFNSRRNLGWMTAGMGARVGQICKILNC